MPDRHPYRVTSRRGALSVIWQAGEGDDLDTLAVDERGRLLAFHTVGTLGAYGADRGWDLAAESGQDGPASLDLDAVRTWLEGSRDRPAPTGLLLEAWNFFEDLARSVVADRPLPPRGAVHDGAYEKLFGTGGAEAWTDAEAAAASGLLRAGLDLWEDAVRGALTPDAFPLSRPPAAPAPPRGPRTSGRRPGRDGGASSR
ncbi:hypothetical protein [Streptomyces narbonensis]|uniref:hypothetical protein n=1 Tax=Streptomyces narbonensis TaxID=67333 RepID=UPI0033D07349